MCRLLVVGRVLEGGWVDGKREWEEGETRGRVGRKKETEKE